MAIQNPGLILAIEAMFGLIRPSINDLLKLGGSDFSAGAPNMDIKPGATTKIPISSVSAASEYNETTNNYLTGGDTDWAQLTATHFLQGYDLKGSDIDSGVDGPRIKQLFGARAAAGIALAASGVTASALTGVTASTGITLPAVPTYAEYDQLFGAVETKNKLNAKSSVLGVTGSELGKIKSAYHDKGISFANDAEIAALLGFADLVVVSGATGRVWIVPPLALGFIGRVPTILARYASAGVETDPESGLSIGVVVADDQTHNRQIVNADLWFGCAVLSANAAATTAGIVKVGTAAG